MKVSELIEVLKENIFKYGDGFVYLDEEELAHVAYSLDGDVSLLSELE